MMAVMVLALPLATAGRWLASGCPVGFRCGRFETRLGERAVIASSDHLLTHMSMTGKKNWVQIDLEGRAVVVRESDVTIDGVDRCVIPTGCKQVELMASGRALCVLVDGKVLEEVRR
jgi:hypothetical protein